jgi:hypothetical protein
MNKKKLYNMKCSTNNNKSRIISRLQDTISQLVLRTSEALQDILDLRPAAAALQVYRNHQYTHLVITSQLPSMKVDELRGEMEVDEAGRGEPYALIPYIGDDTGVPGLINCSTPKYEG